MSTDDLLDLLDSAAALEATAAVAHQRWAHWQRYLHDQCEAGPDGALVMPAELVRRWEQQIHTTYDDLSSAEKDSDREQAAHYLSALRDLRKAQNTRAVPAPDAPDAPVKPV